MYKTVIEKTMRKIFVFSLALLLSVCGLQAAGAAELSLVPLPASVETGTGEFVWKDKQKVVCPDYPGDSIRKVCERFSADLRQSTGVELRLAKKGRGAVVLTLDAELAPEAYRLDVGKDGIRIRASRPSGFFYAFQTVKQLMPRNVVAGKRADKPADGWTVPAVSIADEPRFGWRGFMLDEGRHFFGKETVKHVLDIMSTYKLNRFHWHLTEDQGWRIEIKKYPRLTEVGAWRNSRILAWKGTQPDGQHYGGFYTQDDIREIVAYARERFIEIVPEIDMPGHFQAALAAYPELSCTPDQKHEVWLRQGVSGDVMNVASPKSIQFAKDIIDELIELFPFNYIHIGGDECPTHAWEQNAECQALYAEIGAKTYRDLQGHFYRQLEQHIQGKPAAEQRHLIAWNEILGSNTDGLDLTVMAWVGADKAAQTAAGRGMDVILSPQIPYYINRKQSKDPSEPLSQGYGNETVEAVYNYKPADNVAPELLPHYIGVQANFWTEYVIEPDFLEYLMLPRLAAVAEAGWTPQERRTYDSFKQRIQADAKWYELCGFDYGKHIFE